MVPLAPTLTELEARPQDDKEAAVYVHQTINAARTAALHSKPAAAMGAYYNKK